jgi:hypothetical protein
MKRIVLLLLLSLSCAGYAHSEELYNAAPTDIPRVERDMKRPGFWIARHPSPDKVILDPGKIGEFNLHIQDDLKLVVDITKFPSLAGGGEFKAHQSESLKKLKAEGLYTVKCDKAGDTFYGPIERNMDLGAVPEKMPVRFGFVVKFADQRILPTSEGLYAKPHDLDFDELQNSGLDIGTPVAVLYKSRDNKWLYTQSALSRGWVEADKVAFCERKEFEIFMRDYKPVVVTSAKADIFLDPGLKDYYGYIKMGTTLAFSANIEAQVVEVVVPLRESSGAVSFRKGYMRKEAVKEGYLPYTARNIIQQAFELFNEPYGWGDMRGEQDCSRFIQQIFATTGIQLPRNAIDQAKTGLLLGEFDKTVPGEEKIKILKQKAVGGLTLLYLKGHIMLFLGRIDGAPYAIHATWAYRENVAGQDRIRLVNRVAVTDLALGKGAGKGSLLERLVAIRLIAE